MSTGPGPGRARRALPDVLGLAWVVGAAVAVLVPALAHGASLGPFDVLAHYGLSRRAGVVVHYTGPADQIQQMIPWTDLAWHEVHQGHLPLWNPYSGLGTPLAFNWQSAVFSVPTLLSYLFPVRVAFTVVQVTTLLVAGSGAYVFARVLRLGALGAATAATVYELSGPVMGWLGWPNAGTTAWAGWIFAAGLLVLRGGHRPRHVALLALALACAVYGGQPEAVVLMALALAVFVVVHLLVAAQRGQGAAVLAPVVDLALAGGAGVALSAPLLLPGLQVASTSVVRSVSRYGALPPHDLAHVLFSGFDGLPVAGSHWFGNSIYPETAAYVGAVALALVVTALGTRRRQPAVPALAAVVVGGALLAYAQPVVSVLNDLTGLSSVAWHRSVIEMCFALALLAGFGADALACSGGERPVRRWTAAGFGAVVLVLAAEWLVGRGHLPPADASIRDRSFVWPAALAALGLVVTGLLALPRRRVGAGDDTTGPGGPGRLSGAWAGAILVAAETAFLVASGAPLVSSSADYVSTTPAEAALVRTVGASLVGLGGRDCHLPPGLGVLPDVNVVMGLHELTAYDPMTPHALFAALAAATGRPAAATGAPLVLCPAFGDAAVARRFGVGYLLVPAGHRRPTGTTFVRNLDDEALYRVPGAGAAALATPGPGGGFPSTGAPSVPLSVTHPGPASWRVTFDAPGPRVLELHLVDVPGWHAALDGRPLALHPYGGAMLAARVPTGRHTVTLDYRPEAFTVGLVLGAGAAVALVAALGVGQWRARRRGAHTAQAGSPAPT